MSDNPFHKLATSWWDKEGPFHTLHDINPCRLDYIQKLINLSGKTVLDLGCGGGILSEALARQGAQVLGIDIEENDFDEFENLPYYNKYKDREISQISDKEFEAVLDLNNDNNEKDHYIEEDENSNLNPIPLSSKKMFDEEDNKIKEFVEEDIEIKENKKRKSNKKTKENVGKSKSMKKKKTKK